MLTGTKGLSAYKNLGLEVEDSRALFSALSLLRNRNEVELFFRDLATPGELAAFAERWRIARMLDRKGHSYREIAAATGASTTTIGRVARFLRDEKHQGYRLILDRMKSLSGAR